MSHIRGLDSWESWMVTVPNEVKQEVKDLIAITAYKIEADAKLLAPVDTGHLRMSINTEISNTGLSAEIGTNVDYSVYVEFGTRYMHPQPFMIPAAIKNKDEFEKELKTILDNIGR